MSPEEARKALELLLGRLGRVRWNGDLVEAIGRVGAGAGIPAEQRIKVSHLLGRIIERPSSKEDAQLREVQTARGKVYEITGRVEFDSETLPAAVRGLEAIALSPETTPALRRQVAEQLLRAWEGVGKWKVIWGPRAAEALVQTLGRIGADERSDGPTRARIVQELLFAIERLSVVRALEAIFSLAAAAPELGGLAAPAGAKLLDHWIQPEITPEELQAVLSAAAGAACRPEIPGAKPAGAPAPRARERTALRRAAHRPSLGAPGAAENARQRRDSRADEKGDCRTARAGGLRPAHGRGNDKGVSQPPSSSSSNHRNEQPDEEDDDDGVHGGFNFFVRSDYERANFGAALASGRIIVFDGAMGTILAARGVEPGSACEHHHSGGCPGRPSRLPRGRR